jgi:hypothetical protein
MEKERGKEKRHNGSPSVEDYLNMDEDEKDVAIQKAVIRLQTRIHEILYLMESEIKANKGKHKKESKNDGKK